MKVLESSENYLETILILHRKSNFVRAVDVARYLNFSKASVSIALKSLKENNFIMVEESGNIVLLDKGREIAEKIFEKHQFLTVALMQVGVDQELAMQDACKIEHVISDETFKAIQKHLGENYNGKPIRDMF